MVIQTAINYKKLWQAMRLTIKYAAYTLAVFAATVIFWLALNS